MPTFNPGTILMQMAGDIPISGFAPGWFLFQRPLEQLKIRAGYNNAVEEIKSALAEINAAIASGKWAAGFIAYEAAPAFDSAFRVRQPETGAPLLWFGIYDNPAWSVEMPEPNHSDSDNGLPELNWLSDISDAEYAARHARVQEYITAGDTYQVNLTHSIRAQFDHDPYLFFRSLHAAQQARYGAFLRGEEFAMLSASPELFFAQSEDRVIARPMKGTAPRGRWCADDQRRSEMLQTSPKEQAENVMIVDLLRNDLGRIARSGSVHVERLFKLERYPTVWQLTSTIAAQTAAAPTEVLAALFPCGSVTGAPKVRTMEIIAELESSPRGVYCGAIGCIGPGRIAQFNVAIRTVWCDLTRRQAIFGVGGGVTADSQVERESAENKVKARILESRAHAWQSNPFELLETLLWEPDSGYFLLEGHLARLAASADYFEFVYDLDRVRLKLVEAINKEATATQRVRLLMNRPGEVRIERAELKSPFGASSPAAALKLASRKVRMAGEPVDPEDIFLFHKTTHRKIYDRACADWPEMDDVLFCNLKGEITESTTANIVVEHDGQLLTPARECGLLAGVFRESLLQTAIIEEARLTLNDLRHAKHAWLINSVRRWLPLTLEE